VSSGRGQGAEAGAGAGQAGESGKYKQKTRHDEMSGFEFVGEPASSGSASEPAVF
jgi:hypothetical protein